LPFHKYSKIKLIKLDNIKSKKSNFSVTDIKSVIYKLNSIIGYKFDKKNSSIQIQVFG
jgi:hypothetical protein